MKKAKFIFILFCALLALTSCQKPQPYGVFIGVGPEDASALRGYETVVIDAAYFSAEDIQKLHEDGQTVYSYLNAGALEDFRPYFSQFSQYILDAYEGWPGEYWMDITQREWTEYLLSDVAKGLASKGVDGLFIDNLDVYGQYLSEEAYQAIIMLLQGIQREYSLPVLVNGGDIVVEKIIGDGTSGLIFGVNQECVFTAIDFDTGASLVQNLEDTAYYKDYLAQCKNAGLAVYLTEYGASGALEKEVEKYCGENGFTYYIAPDLTLEG